MQIYLVFFIAHVIEIGAKVKIRNTFVLPGISYTEVLEFSILELLSFMYWNFVY